MDAKTYWPVKKDNFNVIFMQESIVLIVDALKLLTIYKKMPTLF